MPFPFGSGFQGYVICAKMSIYIAGDTEFDESLFRQFGRRFQIDLALLSLESTFFPGFAGIT